MAFPRIGDGGGPTSRRLAFADEQPQAPREEIVVKATRVRPAAEAKEKKGAAKEASGTDGAPPAPPSPLNHWWVHAVCGTGLLVTNVMAWMDPAALDGRKTTASHKYVVWAASLGSAALAALAQIVIGLMLMTRSAGRVHSGCLVGLALVGLVGAVVRLLLDVADLKRVSSYDSCGTICGDVEYDECVCRRAYQVSVCRAPQHVAPLTALLEQQCTLGFDAVSVSDCGSMNDGLEALLPASLVLCVLSIVLCVRVSGHHGRGF